MNPTTQGITVGADIKTLKPALPVECENPHFESSCFAPECFGLAAEALLDGKTDRLRFVRARHNPATNIWEIVDQVFVGLDDGSDDDEDNRSKGSVRWASVDGDPVGNGSHSVIASWSPHYATPACVAAVLADAFASTAAQRIGAVGVFWIELEPVGAKA